MFKKNKLCFQFSTKTASGECATKITFVSFKSIVIEMEMRYDLLVWQRVFLILELIV